LEDKTMLPMFRFYRPALANDILRNQLWNDLLDTDEGYSAPAVNIAEEKNEYRIEVAAPGLEKNDFRINLENNVLTISSEKETKKEEPTGSYTRKEFSYSTFKRSFTLPETVSYENISATHKNGILYVSVPKREEVKTLRQIEIQ
jgi:HSP20 family protein